MISNWFSGNRVGGFWVDLGILSFMVCFAGIPFCWSKLREGLKVPWPESKRPWNQCTEWMDTPTYRHKVGWRTLAALLSFYQIFWRVFCVPKSCNDGQNVKLDRCLRYKKSSTTIFCYITMGLWKLSKNCHSLWTVFSFYWPSPATMAWSHKRFPIFISLSR